MFKTLRKKFASFIARDYIRGLHEASKSREKDFENRVNHRVAAIILGMDPFEPLLREWKGVFSEEFEKVEEGLSEKSSLGMKMWAYGLSKDPHFKHLTDWVMNSQGNETLKRAPVSNERTLYGRACLATMILFRKEVKRLSSLYEEMLQKAKGEDFNSEMGVE